MGALMLGERLDWRISVRMHGRTNADTASRSAAP